MERLLPSKEDNGAALERSVHADPADRGEPGASFRYALRGFEPQTQPLVGHNLTRLGTSRQ